MDTVKIIIRDQTSRIVENEFMDTIRHELARSLWGFKYDELYANGEKIPLDHGHLNKNVCDIFILLVDDELSNTIEPIEDPDVRFSWTFFATDECPAIILFNYWNWMNAHKPLGISNEIYRRYVIWHEIGHAHGLKHVKLCDIEEGDQLPVMFQMTNQPKEIVDKYKVVGEPMDSEIDDLKRSNLIS